MISTLTAFGANSAVLWEWAGGVCAIFMVMALIVACVGFIRRLVNSA